MKKIAAFLAALSLVICTGCTGREQEAKEPEAEKPNTVTESVQPEEQETEEILQRESVLYQKYSRTLREIDKNREECTIFGEDGWENAKDCYRAVLSETMFGMFEHNKYDYKDTVNEMRGILAAEAVGIYCGRRSHVREPVWDGALWRPCKEGLFSL